MEKSIKKYWPIFVLPTLAAFIIGFIIPFAQGMYLAFCKFTTIKNAVFVGFDNFTKIFTNEVFSKPFSDAFVLTAIFALTATVLINALALSVALLLTRKLRGTNFFRTVFFMPNLIGGIILGYIWQILLNCVLSLLGKPLLALDSTAGYWGLIILMCWQQIGYMMIIYIAGLQAIPEELTEAAEIDGANSWVCFWKVKFRMIMPSITICTFLVLTNSFKLFDQNLSLTGGEPARATEMLALNIYRTFYDIGGGKYKGVGQAEAVLFFILVTIISLFQLRSTRSKEVQQ